MTADEGAPDISSPPVLDVLARQRACRSYTPDPVPDHDVELMLASAGRAPSAENRQPWVFVVIRDETRRMALWELAERAWTARGRAASAEHLDDGLFRDVDHGMTGGFASAPVTVVVALDRNRAGHGDPGSSIYPAAQNLLIAATALGYGSALTTIALVHADELAALLGLPPSIVPMVIVPIGRPTKPLGRSRRDPVARHTYRETYAHGW